ncbi:HtaA domain-containing protein [Cnuibacter sp. UC19_7]|uniref:HtaA domain-containing protein n=1 Tax=Cnuibacter sp. UC19_7 TaxID=3350166 RepID=UPI00366F6C13
MRPLAGLVVGAVVSGLAVVGVAAPATAATGDVTGATVDWGFKDSWRGYVARFGGTATASGGASTSPAYRWSSGTGTFDATTGTADVDLAGTVAWSVPAHGISISLSDPEIVLDGDGTGELIFDYVDSTGASGTGVFATLSGAVPVLADGVATFTGVAATAGPATAAVFTGSYPEGSALDPVSFALPYEQAPVQQSTTTTLGVSPSGSVEQGTDVELSATVSPAADGTVQFTDGGSRLGAPVAVTAGEAITSVGDLTVGEHSLGAEFTPADPALFAGSSASAVALTVTGSTTPAVTTTTSVALSPAAPVVLGTATTATATVAAASGTATGSVEFFDVTDGTADRVSLGTAAVDAGVATWTGKLGAGGHTVAAVYRPTGGFAGSEGTPTANYGVVDTTAPAACTVDAGSPDVTGVAASWDWSAYSAEWSKSATGEGVRVDGDTFTFSDGVATHDQDCTIVQFDGSIRVTAYPQFGGFWIDLADPTLVVGADGAGLWTADVTTFESATPKRLVVDTVTLGARPDFTASGEATAALDYDGTTASGTWKAGHDSAWANDFVVNVPSSIRPFYYASGTAKDADKAPSPLHLAWTVAPTPSDAGSLVWGFKQSWRSYVAGIAQGSITPSNGASTTAGGLFEFVQTDEGDFDPSTRVGSVAYQGTVSFQSRAHGFDIAIADPIVRFDGTGTATLSLLVSSSDTAGTSDMTRSDVATLTIPAGQPSGDPLTWIDLPAVFAAQLPGSFEQYAGQAADPVTLTYGAVVPPVIVPAVSLSSTEVRQGEELVVTGTGFGPGERVAATVFSDPVALEPQTADAQGNVAFRWTVPADFATGAHTVEVTSAAGTASAQFTVTAPAVAPAVPAVDSPAAQQCVAQQVGGATMSWGVKDSFRTYITGPIAKGAISTSGVSDNGGSYGWSGGSGAYNPSDSLGRVAYSGSVHFTGHGGQLDLTIANPRIQITGSSSAVLIADISSKQLSGGTVAVSGTIATLSLSGGSSSSTSTRVSYSGVPATLTEYGASAFGGFYSGGAALDPVSFTWPLGADVPCDTTTDGKLASTGVNGSDAMGGLVAALALLVLGAGAVAVRRRRVRA